MSAAVEPRVKQALRKKPAERTQEVSETALSAPSLLIF